MNEPVLVNDPGAKGNRRLRKLVAGGLALLLLIGVVLPRVLGGGGGAAEDDFGDFPSAASSPTTVLSAPGDHIQVIGSFSSRDPFAPRVSGGGGTPAPAPEPAPAPAPAAASAPPPDPVQFSVPELFIAAPTAAPPAPAPAPVPPTSTAPPLPAPAPRVERTFNLVEIYTDGGGLEAAHVRVDDQEFQVAVGQDFGGSYRTLALDRSNKCGVFLFGDRRFSLCEGESTRT